MTTGRKNISAETRERVLVVGATSSLAQALCRALAAQGYALTLAGRDESELELLAADLSARFDITCLAVVADLLVPSFDAATFLDHAGEFEHLILAVGDMGGDPADPVNLAFTAQINFVLPAQIAAVAAQRMSYKGRGSVVIISSVAGDRGRRSNYAYGSAKAAISVFASGLRNRFFRHGVHVMTVKPGFIDTPMTWGMKSPLIANRDKVAEKIVAAMKKKKSVLYVPFFWKPIMLIIIHIPEFIFKRLKL